MNTAKVILSHGRVRGPYERGILCTLRDDLLALREVLRHGSQYAASKDLVSRWICDAQDIRAARDDLRKYATTPMKRSLLIILCDVLDTVLDDVGKPTLGGAVEDAITLLGMSTLDDD